jgi:endoglucanase
LSTSKGEKIMPIRGIAGVAAGALLALQMLQSQAVAAEQVLNGTFDGGVEPWWTTGNLAAVNRDGRLCVDVPGGLTNPWDAIVGQNGIQLSEGEGYTLSFEASGDPQGRVRALVQMPVDPYTEYLTIRSVHGPQAEDRSLGFIAPVSRRDAQVTFQLGGLAEDWTFCLDNVVLSGEVEQYVPETGPDIRVNQLGYLPDGPKKSTIVSDAADALPFDIADADGAVVFSGMTRPRGMDESAGTAVHVADFSGLDATGEGFVLRALGQESYPFTVRAGLYENLRLDALGYFYLARSGIEIEESLVGEAYARPAGHVSSPSDGDFNRGDRDVPCQPARVSKRVYGEPWTCDYTLSPVGGWYDAGDHGKYVVNGGISVAQLMSAWEWAQRLGEGAVGALGDGTLPVPERGNGVPDILDEARWELDFMTRMVVPDGDPLSGMVHHKVHDNEWTGVPLLPHLSNKARELHRPSTAATLNAAAVFAQGGRLFEPYDPQYAAMLLSEARSAWRAALAHPAIYATAADGQSGGGPYDDDDIADEFFWAAAELFIATGDSDYLDFLKQSPYWNADGYSQRGFDWKYVAPHARLQLAFLGDGLPQSDRERLKASVVAQADHLIARLNANPFGHAYAPENNFFEWGSSHLVVQNGILLAAAYELAGEKAYRDAAIESMDYVLGRNALNISYVTGYGTVYAKNQHSRWFANQVDPDLPNPPHGSLSGGPNSGIQDPVAERLFGQNGCAPQTCYVDDIESWATNEITINWNAALAQMAAWLAAQ